MNKFKNVINIILVLSFIFIFHFASAEDMVNLVIENQGQEVFSGSVLLPVAGLVDIADSSGQIEKVEARSVLNIVHSADGTSGDFNISDLKYYSSFGAFYLRCITVSGEDLCDNWQYKVGGEVAGMGMDQYVLSGGEEVTLFFGDDIGEIAEPSPEPEPEPIPDPEKKHASSGGSYVGKIVDVQAEGDSLSVKEEVKEIQDDMAVTANPVVGDEQTAKPIPRKIIQKEIIPKFSDLNQANVLEAVPETPVEKQPVKKENWLRNLFKWILGVRE